MDYVPAKENAASYKQGLSDVRCNTSSELSAGATLFLVGLVACSQ